MKSTKPELRVFLRKKCIINPLPAPQQPTPKKKTVVPLAGLFLPKLIELGIGGIATLLKKAGEKQTVQKSGSDITAFYLADDKQVLSANPTLGCILGVYGVFSSQGGEPIPETDKALKRLEEEHIISPGDDISIVFEAAIVPTEDSAAFYLETRHFSVREFIGDRYKEERDYIATLSVTTPSATVDGTTIALGNVALGRIGRETLPIKYRAALGEFPRYRSNLMPWKRITEEAKDIYDSDVKRNTAAGKAYMPVTFTLTISESADGNEFLLELGKLLEGAKADAAKELSSLILPGEREKAAKEEADAAEKLYKNEEDALIAKLEADAAFAAASGTEKEKAVLEAKLAKAERAYNVAVKLREAAGLSDLPKQEKPQPKRA